MKDKQCKQTERFLVMVKRSDYFLSLDDKFIQRYKVKINNMQGYDPYQIKKEELSGDISKFHQCSGITYYSLLHFLFSLSPLTKEELKACESLESYNQFTTSWVKEV